MTTYITALSTNLKKYLQHLAASIKEPLKCFHKGVVSILEDNRNSYLRVFLHVFLYFHPLRRGETSLGPQMDFYPDNTLQ